ncbi:hypothetical protein E2C01_050753 [Portunus trituberculatus]|uniref:Uncharacterized protein n=1 Tax=Portunus trituberculatus TaxID=210409 RepID=A0A5B7GGT8_PORTR|nr:hypothetical protein [Portunus trituberculatus]
MATTSNLSDTSQTAPHAAHTYAAFTEVQEDLLAARHTGTQRQGPGDKADAPTPVTSAHNMAARSAV